MHSGELLANAPAGFVAFRDDGTVTFANATLERLLGRAPGALEGTPLESILTVPSRIFYQTHFFPMLKLHGRADEIYLTLQGAADTVHVLANVVRHDDASEARNDCVLLPIHERRKYEEELLKAKKSAEAANAAKARFLSMMSHDLRTPLGAIAGYVDLLELGIHGALSEGQRADLDRIKRLTQSVQTMVEDILHFTQAETKPLPVKLEPVRLSRLMSDVENTMLPHVQRAGIQYLRSMPQPDLTVRADSARLHRIMTNLMGNAVKFTPAGGRIHLTADKSGELVMLQVSDTGRGIPSDRLADIFKPFVQVQEADTNGGVGLGLAISREFARAMGGDIGVESAPGRGSVFTVTLRASE